jgi:porcupine-like protein
MEYDYDQDIYAKPVEEEVDYHDYYPNGDSEDNMEDVFNEDGFAPFTLTQIYEHCLVPNVLDAVRHVGKLVFWCFMFRILTQAGNRATGGVGGMPMWTSHLASIAIGVVVLAHFFYYNTLYPLALTASSFVFLHLIHRIIGCYRGASVAIFCLSFNVVCELHLAFPHDWQTIRGVQMILSMKLISLGFDMDNFVQESQQDKVGETKENRSGSVCHLNKVPTIFEYFGYALCPATCVFGPWIKYSDYLNIFDNPRWNATWLVKILFTLFFACMFLSISTCWNPWLIPNGNWKWWLAYRDAMSFRASHYFVSYLGEATAVAGGLGFNIEQNNWNGMQVVQPHNIEVPRSLVDVVVSWNMPMHRWLHKYCYRPTIKRFGRFIAIFSTFAASTFLHGLNFQLGAVLFSLGFYTYIEHTLRERLGQIFNASITARRPNPETGVVYRHREGEFLVILVNLFFGLVACFHLAYLGVMFDQQPTQEEGYSWRHTISKWESLEFLSHKVSFFQFFLTLVL